MLLYVINLCIQRVTEKMQDFCTDLLDTLNKYNFLFSEVPSTHSASTFENANGVFVFFFHICI